jgi:tetratricopeptide (TPR) repeat protein
VPRACYNYAAILGAEGNYQSAVDYYQKAMALDTTMIEVKLRLGELYEALGDSTMARIYFQEFVDSAPLIYTDDINRTKAKLEKYK